MGRSAQPKPLSIGLAESSVYPTIRNSVLDASNFYDLSKPRYIRNQFGASFGGPIVHNRTFLFINYEGLRERKGITDSLSLPDSKANNGFLPNVQRRLVFVGVEHMTAPLLARYPVPNGTEVIS